MRLGAVLGGSIITRFTATLLTISFFTPLDARADWPGFRGPTTMGVSTASGLPIKWGPKENVVWKVELPGPGSSSPIVLGERVFITCYSGYGDGTGGQQEKLRRHLLCFERSAGRLLWQKDIPATLPESNFKNQVREHGYGTHTPVTDGQRLYVFFGRTGVFAFDLNGQQLWHTEVGKSTNTFGSGASPVLYKNLVLVNAAVESSSVVALERETGKVVWKAKGISDCWSTPLLVEVPGGRTEVVLNGPAALVGLDPDDGKELWTCDTLPSTYASATPVTRKGIIYVMNAGFEGKQFLAVKGGGRGDVTNTHILWKQNKAGASYCSPLLVGEYLFYVSNGVTCLRADNGEIVFQERLGATGPEYPSPVVADGKIIAPTRRDGFYVLAAKPKFEVLAHNHLGDNSIFNASPAVSRGQLFVRSNRYLYCLGLKK